MTEFRYCKAPTLGVRTCKFKDGSIKDFEDIKAGDVFQIFEPDGTLVYSTDNTSIPWIKAESDYDGISGFAGVWIDTEQDMGND